MYSPVDEVRTEAATEPAETLEACERPVCPACRGSGAREAYGSAGRGGRGGGWSEYAGRGGEGGADVARESTLFSSESERRAQPLSASRWRRRRNGQSEQEGTSSSRSRAGIVFVLVAGVLRATLAKRAAMTVEGESVPARQDRRWEGGREQCRRRGAGGADRLGDVARSLSRRAR
jgi:hypothetical protein